MTTPEIQYRLAQMSDLANLLNLEHSCFVTDTLHVNVLANGIERLTSSALKIYPNPANDFLVIDIAQNAGFNKAKVSIFNGLGQMILQSKIQSQQQIDIRELPAGNYFVEIEANNKRFKYPLVIERW